MNYKTERFWSWPVAVFLALVCVGSFYYRTPYPQLSLMAGRDALSAASGFFAGRISYADSVPRNRLDFDFCKTIAEIVPKSSKVLQINSATNETCVQVSFLTPLFPYYAKDWGIVLYGSPEQAAETLKKSGFDYFHIDLSESRSRFENVHVFSPIFQYPSMMEYFEIFWESDDRYLLTWKTGKGKPVSRQLAMEFTRQVKLLIDERRGYARQYLGHKALRESGAKW
jgi:hypothetical protein